MTETQLFTASDGERIGYYVDDFTDPWRTPPVMFLFHSAMGNSQRFYSWVPGLARHFRLVRMDLRGHGRSSVPPPEKPLTMARLMHDVEELMELLGVKEVHLAANSAGGYVAQNLALHSPGKVLSLAVVGSTPGLSDTVHSWLPRIRDEGLTHFLRDTIAMRFDLASTDPGMVEWFLRQTAENDPDFVIRFIAYAATQEWSGELHRIRCPTMIEYPHMPHNIADMMADRCVADILRFHRDKFGHPKG